MKSKEKKSIQELLADIAASSECDKREVDSFVRSFVNVLDKGIVDDGVVKIKGFGTLKLQWNEPRKSVNVRTGEEYVIPGHNKLVFVPENAVKDLINEKYAQMRAMDVNEENGNDENEQLAKLHNQALEIKGLLDDFNKVDKKESVSVEPAAEPQPEAKEETVVKETASVAAVTASTSETIVSASNGEGYVEPAPIENYDTGERKVPLVKKKKMSKVIDWILIAFLVISLCGVIFYIEKETSCFSSFFDTEIANIKQYINERDSDDAERKEQERLKEKERIQRAALKAREEEMRANAEKTGISDSAGYVPVEIPQKPKANAEKKEKPSAATAESADKKDKADNKPAAAPAKPASSEIIATVTIGKGDRLTLLAEKYYGHKDYWVYIFEANKSVIKNPDAVSAGMKLKIPKLGSDKVDVNNPQTLTKAKELAKQYLKK
jgi:nucleoid DNA-binding protein